MARQIKYLFKKICSKFKKNPDEYMNKFFRKNDISIGEKCHIYLNIISSEPFLITIGNNVTISSEVIFCTHDNSIIKVDGKMPNLFGKVTIGDNCFVGQRSMLMYGVTLANNIIVAAGSVVTNSFDEEGIIIGGVPARKIGTFQDFSKKSQGKRLGRKNLKETLLNHPELLVVRKSKRD